MNLLNKSKTIEPFDMKWILYVLFGFLSIFSIQTQAQNVESFPSDSVKFVKRMADFMGNTKDQDRNNAVMDKFEKLWKKGIINDRFRADIYRHSNLMLDKKAKPYPHFEAYLYLMMAFAQQPDQESNYVVWSSYFNEFIKRNKLSLSNIERFLDNSLNLFESNSLFKNTIVQWKSSTNDFVLKVENNDIKVVYPKMDLICLAKRDSAKIFETKGYYTFQELVFHGDEGLITWERSGIGRDTISASFKKFNIDLSKSEYHIDSVLFLNRAYFTEGLYGSIHEKVIYTGDEAKVSYPKFDSFTRRFEMKNIFPEVNYSGGFAMNGSQFYGSGSKEEPAQLTFFRKDTLVMTIKSNMIIFKTEQVLSSDAIAKIVLDKDSIYHPGLKFNFNIKKRLITLTRDKENMGRAPYINTYHQVDMLVGKILWDMAKPKLDFMPGPTQQVAYFESADYYSEDKYLELQKLDMENPLAAVRNYIRSHGNHNEFYVKDFADYMRMSIPAAHKYLLALAFEGFINYNLNDDKVLAKEKLNHYLKASVGDKDYDVLGFISNTEGQNGELSLISKELKLHGVTQIFLSDSQNVVVFPKNGEIRLGKDRDFSFDGRVNAGMFHFYGSNFKFSYKNFKIDLNNVERLQMHVKSLEKFDRYGDPELIPVQTPLNNIKGDLLIDKPFNKSGIKPSPEYPIFNSFKESYAYYESPDIQNGAYKRDNFYFQVYPHSFDSLDNYKRKSLVFDGYFNSADILPGMEEKLVLRPDYSLGFHKETPAQGYPIYSGKANLSGTVDLSNAGLMSTGEIRYLTSLTKSDNITMLPEQLIAKAQNFDNTKTSGPPEYPLVVATDVNVNWYAYRDSMVTESVEKPIMIYDDRTKLTGATILQPSGMSGWGLVDMTTGELISEKIRFNENTLDSDTSSFSLKTEGTQDFDFKTNNVNAHIDFVERKGVFKSNGEASFVEFTANEYICFMDQFTWYMDRDELDLSASEKAQSAVKTNEDLGPLMEEDVELEGSQFISVHPRQDSLNFVAPIATYNTRTKLITAKDVKYIRVADAVIYPTDGIVEVEKRAVMRTLTNSKIVANSATRFHTIYNAATNIYGRREYTSSGYYDFYNQDSVKQVIHFDVVGVDSTMQTYARGKIGLTDEFTFNPKFAYNGKVLLFANNEHLTFSGYTKIAHECNKTMPQWIKFEAPIDPKEIQIPITSPIENINEAILHASLMITNDSAHIYPAFLGPHEKYSDTEIIPTEGFLIFDKAEGKYKIASKDKLEEESLPGNLVSLHHSVCNFYGEGTINLGVNLGRFILKNGGNINQNATAENTVLNLVMFMEFFFPDKCMNIMAKDLESASDGFNMEDLYYQGITEIVGKTEAEEYISNLSLGSIKKYPKVLETGMVIGNVKLRWDGSKRMYKSDGPIAIGSILKKQVNREVFGHMQIIKKRSGNVLHLYLEANDNTWYYFNYDHNVLKAVSSNQEFNTILREMKPGDRKLPAEKEKLPYSFMGAPESLVKKFLKQFGDGDEVETGEEEGGKEENVKPSEEEY